MTNLYIKSLNIMAFGKFESKKIDFDRGFNLVYGLNESGKTTIKNFIEGIFYGFDEGRTRSNFNYKKEAYRPKHSYMYAGELDLVKDGILYRIYRNFDSGEYLVTDILTGEKIEGQASDLSFPGKFFLGFDYLIYQNYISFKQDDIISEDSKKKIVEKLASSDIDYNFSIKNSLEILDKKLTDIGSPRAYTKPYYKTKEEIKELREKVSSLKSLRKKSQKSFRDLEAKKKDLEAIRKTYDKLKLKNEIYNKRRSDENFREYKKWADKLQEVNNKLKEFDLDQLREEDFAYYDELILKKSRPEDFNIFPYLTIALLVVVISFIIKNFLPLLLIIPLIFYGVNKSKERDSIDFSEFGLSSLAEYNKLKAKFKKFKSLRKEKERLEEVVGILKNQDLGLSDEDYGIDFDFEGYDNLRALDGIRALEEEIEEKRSGINKLEKNLITIDNDLKDEVRIKDELKSLEDKFLRIEEEIEAINLAKEKILEIQNESKKDMTRLNKSIKDVINKTLRSEFRLNFDDNLSLTIEDKNKLSYDINQLSQGFFDQVSFSLKYILARDFLKDSFLIFDDGFINYDIERLIKSLFFLLDLSDTRQLIYFTCHEREREFFKAENIRIKIINLEDI